MAVADDSYKFVMVDVGAPGRHSDGGVFKATYASALRKID